MGKVPGPKSDLAGRCGFWAADDAGNHLAGKAENPGELGHRGPYCPGEIGNYSGFPLSGDLVYGRREPSLARFLGYLEKLVVCEPVPWGVNQLVPHLR